MGTPRAITRSSDNAVVWKWENSDPFGANAPNEDPANTGTAFKYNLRFPGQYYDQETQTHYNYFRDYQASTGRYLQSDPMALAGGLNTFAYIKGNPISKIDKFGLRDAPDIIARNSIDPIIRGNPFDTGKGELNRCPKRPPPESPDDINSDRTKIMAGSIATGGAVGAISGGVINAGFDLTEAAHAGAAGGVLVADGAATGAMTGGVFGAGAGVVIATGIILVLRLIKCP